MPSVAFKKWGDAKGRRSFPSPQNLEASEAFVFSVAEHENGAVGMGLGSCMSNISENQFKHWRSLLARA